MLVPMRMMAWLVVVVAVGHDVEEMLILGVKKGSRESSWWRGRMLGSKANEDEDRVPACLYGSLYHVQEKGVKHRDLVTMRNSNQDTTAMRYLGELIDILPVLSEPFKFM